MGTPLRPSNGLTARSYVRLGSAFFFGLIAARRFLKDEPIALLKRPAYHDQ